MMKLVDNYLPISCIYFCCMSWCIF